MRNAKIVCTLGPATDDEASVRALADAGMTVARINASHGSLEDRAALVDTAREVDEDTDEPVRVETGSEVAFAEGDTSTPERVGLSTSIAAAEPGDRVLLDDGRIEA